MRWNGDYGGVEGKGGVNGGVGGVMGLKGGLSGSTSRIGRIWTYYVRGLWTNGYGGVHGRWAGVSLGGGEKGREVVLGRNIEWGGLIYLGCYLLEKEGGGIIPINEGLGVWFSGQRRQPCWD